MRIYVSLHLCNKRKREDFLSEKFEFWICSATGATGSRAKGLSEHRAVPAALFPFGQKTGQIPLTLKAWLAPLVLEILPVRLARKGLTLCTCRSLCLVFLKNT